MSYWEQQYNPRSTVPDAQRYFDRWRARANDARASLAADLDVSYGAHERERLDVFRAAPACGALVFLHGGYWRAFGREDFSWVAKPWIQAGISVIIPSYPLCPGVRLPSICTSVAAAMRHIAAQVLTPSERERVVLVGHSAGAHLAAHYCAHSAAAANAPLDLAAVVCVSGVFDLVPLLHVQFVADMGWDAAELHAVSPLYDRPPGHTPLILAVGGTESREFHRQSKRLADAWADRCAGVFRIAGEDHFSVIDTLYEPTSLLSRSIADLFP